jgi:Domain of unknown function (DUF4260)
VGALAGPRPPPMLAVCLMKILAPKTLLHLEGLAVLVGATWLYRDLGASWRLFALLFLAPDLFMLGYLLGTRVGARVYNIGHTTLIPAALLVIAYYGGRPALFPFGLIWIAHIGFDRMLGYGLKYEDAFKSTHLGRV